jgi:hypothetical protein
MHELWKPVTGWQGRYEVSSLGRMRSVDRVDEVTNRFGCRELRSHKGRLLLLGQTKTGYVLVTMTRPGAIRACKYVHRLVAEAFIGPCPNGMEVCHGDNDRANNASYNLRYDTRSSNALDRHRHGTMNQARGSTHYFAKIDEKMAADIYSACRKFSERHVAKQFCVSRGLVRNVKTGATWKHVTNPSGNVSSESRST